MRVLVLLVALLASFSALAVEPAERLANPALEARARAISSELRCLVCQNESIDESHAELAHDIRMLVRERLLAGDSDAQTQMAVVDRYGNFVLLRPPVNGATWVLWFGPLVLLLCGVTGLGLFAWRRQARVPAVPLSAMEQMQLARLLRENER